MKQSSSATLIFPERYETKETVNIIEEEDSGQPKRLKRTLKFNGDDSNVRTVRSTPCSGYSSQENSSDSNDQLQRFELARGLAITFQRIESMVTPINVTTSGFELINTFFQSKTEFNVFLKDIRNSNIVFYNPKTNIDGIVDPDCTEKVKIGHILKFLRTRYNTKAWFTIQKQLGLDDEDLNKFYDSLSFVNDWRNKIVHCDVNSYDDNFDKVCPLSRDPELKKETLRKVFMRNLKDCLFLLQTSIINRQTPDKIVSQVTSTSEKTEWTTVTNGRQLRSNNSNK